MSKEDGDRVAADLRRLAKDPPLYHPLSFNCNQFACFAASAGSSDGATALRCISPLDTKWIESWFTP